jgi:hypothetical protein
MDPRIAVAILADQFRKVPHHLRSKIYAVGASAFAAVTLAVAVFPYADVVGVTLPARWVSALTALGSLLALLAKANVTPPVSQDARLPRLGLVAPDVRSGGCCGGSGCGGGC